MKISPRLLGDRQSEPVCPLGEIPSRFVTKAADERRRLLLLLRATGANRVGGVVRHLEKRLVRKTNRRGSGGEGGKRRN